MSAQTPKRLKRGLKDISECFDSEKRVLPSSQPISAPKAGIVSSIFYVEKNLKDSKIENLIESKMDCLWIGIENDPSEIHSRSFSLLFEEWIDGLNVSLKHTPPPADVVFLDFDYNQTLHLEKFIPLLDHWILATDCCMENLVKVYKTIKAAIPLNPQLDYYLYCVEKEKTKAELLYEKFSELITRHFGVNLFWVGYGNQLELQSFLLKKKLPSFENLEKQILFQKISEGELK